MKLKLNNSEFKAIYMLLQAVMNEARPSSIETKLWHGVLMDVYRKFYKKAFDLGRKKYSVELSTHEACAWWMFFQHYPIAEEMVFERNLILKINTEIHRTIS